MNKKFAIVLALSLIAIVCCAGCIDPQEQVDPVDPVVPVDPVDPVTPPVEPVVPAVEYSVFFMLNYDGAGAYSAETVTAGDAVSKPATPTRSGYTFKGWFTAAEGGAPYDFTQAVNADLTLYAQWKKVSSSSGSSSSGSSSGSSTPSTPSESPDVVASIGDVTYTSLLEAINAAQDGDTINVRAKTIDEELTPWGGDSTHAIEKNITILGVNHDKNPSTWTGTETILTGGLYLGYDDSQTREHTITIKGITFQGNGLKIADQKDVVIENNKFTNIDGRAIAVLDQNKNGVEGSATITNNIIDTSSSVGIEVRNPHNVEITGNNIANTQANGIQLTGGVSGVATIKENKLKDWTPSLMEGYAVRVVLLGSGSVSVNKNILIYTGNAKESYIKVTGNGVSADVSENYWNGNIPTESHNFAPYYLENRDVEPVSEIKSYYKDEALTQLVDLAVAKIGDESYYSLTEAINDASDGETINVMPGVITEEVRYNDVNDNGQKSITILGANADVNPITGNWNNAEDTILTGGLYFGVDGVKDPREQTIVVKGITFMNKGLLIAGQDDVTVENNRFIDITSGVASTSTHHEDAISVLDQINDANDGKVVIKNNYINGADCRGIYLRSPGNVTIDGNHIENVKVTSINSVWNSADPAFNNVVYITNNIMNTWGTKDSDSDNKLDGRALRASFNASGYVSVTFTGNTMINANSPEEFVKITGSDKVVIDGNNWNNVEGIKPLTDYVPTAVNVDTPYLVADGDITITYILPDGATLTDLKNLIGTIDSEKVTIKFSEDVAGDGDETITIASGKDITLDLNGKTLSAETDVTGSNRELFLVKGTLTVQDGTVTLEHEGDNMGWSSMSAIFDVTAGGVLNMDGVTAQNLGGTDMNFVVHLNNWGTATLIADECSFEATYCGVRVFNSGNDMNTVTITNSVLTGNNRVFWVHNYEGTDYDDTLTIDIFNNGNTFTVKDSSKPGPIMYGFSGYKYYDESGNVVSS